VHPDSQGEHHPERPEIPKTLPNKHLLLRSRFRLITLSKEKT
jgi:hypothetical protein